MINLTFKEYEKEKFDFIAKHGGLKKVYASAMVEDGYHKEYLCEDNAMFYEKCDYEYVKKEIEVYNFTTLVSIKLFRVEMWNSDDATSKYYRERVCG